MSGELVSLGHPLAVDFRHNIARPWLRRHERVHGVDGPVESSRRRDVADHEASFHFILGTERQT